MSCRNVFEHCGSWRSHGVGCDFLNYIWKQKGELGKTWDELVTDFKERFPQISHYSEDHIVFKLKKLYKIKFMDFNSKPARITQEDFLQRAYYMAHHMCDILLQGKKVLFFDGSAINGIHFRRKSLGKTHLRPTRQKIRGEFDLNFIVLLSPEKVEGIQVHRRAATAEQQKLFLSQCLTKLARETPVGERGWILTTLGY